MKNSHDILFPYAYNILGSAEDAKDVIQDALVKYISIDKKHIKNEIGYLVKSVVNQAINLKKKRSRAITSEVWLPEPISTDNADSNINKEEILSYSMLALIEKLTAKERAVFILKEAFDYSHREIADTLGLTIENSRKLLSRSRTKLEDNKSTGSRIPQKDSSLSQHYVEAMKNGDVSALEQLLSEDIQLAADGGESIKVVRELTSGITNTSRLLLYVYHAFLAGLEIEFAAVNHQPAILYYQNGSLYNCQVYELEGQKIRRIFSIVDPNKLRLLFP